MPPDWTRRHFSAPGLRRRGEHGHIVAGLRAYDLQLFHIMSGKDGKLHPLFADIRPDIILRLTKKKKGIKYTFLFDAKYRIDDTPKQGMDVPPPSAIDQMHRYRDAIYYIEQETYAPKREVIGGYVLFPGNYTKDEYENSYYHQYMTIQTTAKKP